jgi:hypothetical protein
MVIVVAFHTIYLGSVSSTREFFRCTSCILDACCVGVSI